MVLLVMGAFAGYLFLSLLTAIALGRFLRRNDQLALAAFRQAFPESVQISETPGGNLGASRSKIAA